MAAPFGLVAGQPRWIQRDLLDRISTVLEEVIVLGLGPWKALFGSAFMFSPVLSRFVVFVLGRVLLVSNTRRLHCLNCVTFDILEMFVELEGKTPKPAFAYADCSAVAERSPTALADSQDSIPG